MKREPLLILVMGTITVGALAFAASVFRAGQPVETFSLDRLHDSSYMIRALHLDPPQVQQLALLNAGLCTRLKGSCRRNCTARRDLVAAVEAGDKVAYEEILRKMCKAYEEGERATLDHIEAVRGLLSTEQRATFDRLTKRCLCGGCEEGCE